MPPVRKIPPLPWFSWHRIKEQLRQDGTSGGHLANPLALTGCPGLCLHVKYYFCYIQTEFSPKQLVYLVSSGTCAFLCREWLHLLCICPLATGILSEGLFWALPSLGWANHISSTFFLYITFISPLINLVDLCWALSSSSVFFLSWKTGWSIPGVAWQVPRGIMATPKLLSYLWLTQSRTLLASLLSRHSAHSSLLSHRDLPSKALSPQPSS